MGIGLSIVREIAEQHGGRLEGASARGAGSCFRLLVPMDFRRAEPWRLVQIASGLRLAQAVGVPLSVVEIGVSADGGAEDPGAWEGGREGEGESGSVERRASSVERKAQEAKDASRFTLSRSHAHTLSQLMQLPMIEQCLEESLRPSDTVVVGEGSATLVLYGVDAAGARGVADRAVRALARLLGRLPEPRPTCRISVGTASYPADGATASALAEAARRPKEEARS